MKIIQFLIVGLLLTCTIQAKIEVHNVDLNKKANKGILTIHYKGELKDYPEMKVVGQSVQVLIPNSKVGKKIEKSFSFSSKLKDTQVQVYQASGNIAKVKTLLPFSVQKYKDQVSLTLKDQKIELSFPQIKVLAKPVKRYKSGKEKKIVKKELLNKAYLDKLLDVRPKTSKQKSKKVEKKPVDQVVVTQASPGIDNPPTNTSFSFIKYGGKFIAFLGLVLLLFYGVISLMKKGFIKRGKLGFLNNAEQISVIGQNYIAPKKSLMLIKAHNQVFLVSNTEQGIHPISEIKDAAGLLKAGEISISGTNFDSNLDDADKDSELEEKVKIKTDIMKSNQESSLSNYLAIKDKVKISDQIKKKIRNLKPLQ